MKKRASSWMKWVTVLSLCSFSSLALAQSTPASEPGGGWSRFQSGGTDTLTLTDGTVLRGQLSELKPGDHVVLVLLDGTSRTIAWSSIASGMGPSLPGMQPKPAARYLSPAPGRVPVTIDSSPRAASIGVLQNRPLIGQDRLTIDDGTAVSQLTTDYQSSTGTVVCDVTPCRIYVRPGLLKLQTSGDDVLSSTSTLTIPPGGAHVQLRAPSAQDAARGRTLLLVGALPVTIAGITLTAMAPGYTDHIFPRALAPTLYGVGGTLLGAGVGMTIAGIVYAVRGRRGDAVVQPFDGSVHF